MNEAPSKTAVGQPGTLVVLSPYSLLPMGAALSPGFDISLVIPDHRILMHQVRYTTPKRIHGLLHGYAPPQLMFVGYECGVCHEVFLVPDSVTNTSELGVAMRHGCTEEPPAQ